MDFVANLADGDQFMFAEDTTLMAGSLAELGRLKDERRNSVKKGFRAKISLSRAIQLPETALIDD